MSTAPNRLNEIAQRRLQSLGVPTRPTTDGAALEGELVGLVRNPFGGKPLERVRFVVEGHDKLRAVAPTALEGLPPVPFFELTGAELIFQQFEQLLHRRLDAARAALAEMRRLRLEAALDAELARAVGRLELTSLGHVVVAAGERGGPAPPGGAHRGGRPAAGRSASRSRSTCGSTSTASIWSSSSPAPRRRRSRRPPLRRRPLLRLPLARAGRPSPSWWRSSARRPGSARAWRSPAT